MDPTKHSAEPSNTIDPQSTNKCSISDIYHEAYAVIDQGICCDEVGYIEGAVNMYERGLQLIDEAGRLKNYKKNDMYQKMSKAREHIVSRLSDLKKIGSKAPASAATSPSDANGAAPFDLITNTLSCLGNTKNAEELLVIRDGVQLFFIKGQETSVPSYPSFLKIFKFCPNNVKSSSSETSKGNFAKEDKMDISPAFLQVSDWIYPLTPGRSPVLHSTYGAYIFPNPSVDAPDTFVGVILPKDLDSSLFNEFVKLMKEYTAYKEELIPPQLTVQENERLAARIASFLINSSDYVVRQLKKGSDKSADYICRKSIKIRDNTSTFNVITVDPRVQTSVHYLRQGTKIAVKISGYLVEKIGALGAAVGQQVATSVDKRLQASGNNSTGAKVAKDVIEVTSAGVAGIATIWMALEEVSKTLAKCIANETVVVVDHKYGQDAADVTNSMLYSAGFAAATAWNVESLGFKGIAKRSAKSASLAFLKDLSTNEKPNVVDPKKDETSCSSPKAEQCKRVKKN